MFKRLQAILKDPKYPDGRRPIQSYRGVVPREPQLGRSFSRHRVICDLDLCQPLVKFVLLKFVYFSFSFNRPLSPGKGYEGYCGPDCDHHDYA